MDLFAEALSKETSKSVTALRKSRRDELVNLLTEMAAALEIEAKGDQMKLAATTSSQKMPVTGLERGKDIYIRIRAFGPNGYSGWSDIATLMVV